VLIVDTGTLKVNSEASKTHKRRNIGCSGVEKIIFTCIATDLRANRLVFVSSLAIHYSRVLAAMMNDTAVGLRLSFQWGEMSSFKENYNILCCKTMMMGTLF